MTVLYCVAESRKCTDLKKWEKSLSGTRKQVSIDFLFLFNQIFVAYPD